MSYNVRVTGFTDGSTSFSGNSGGAHAKSGTIDGPRVINRMVENDAGAIIDLDGTGAASLVPPLIETNFIFSGDNPGDHAQYTNLIALKGRHGTLTAVIPGAVGYTTKTAPARLIDVTGTWEGTHQPGIANWLAVKAVWQLKDFF